MESSSSKRAKAPGNMMTQVAPCLVDGCNADLRLCRDYHRRHKVCEIHSKTPKVTIGGREQRFCQQCSRFHSLEEFDEGKRSCRKRLDGHNRRRRKSQLPDRNSGLLFSDPQSAPTGRLLSFSSPPILPSSLLGSSWAGLIKSESDMMLYNNSQQQKYIERQNEQSYNQLQFIQTKESLVGPNNGQKMFSDGLNQDRALSLLSPAPSIGVFGLNQPQSVPLLHNYSYCGLGYQYPLAQGGHTAASSTASDSSDPLHIPEVFRPRPDTQSTSGSHQTLTFMRE